MDDEGLVPKIYEEHITQQAKNNLIKNWQRICIDIFQKNTNQWTYFANHNVP